MHFAIIGRIRNVEAVASGRSVRIRKYLIQRFGTGRWRKMKGDATIRFDDGTLQRAKEEPGLAIMMNRGGGSGAFAVCIHNGEYDVDLVVGKIYRVVRAKRNDRRSDIRILDESGEDYLTLVPISVESG